MISGAQIRAARGYVRWSTATLADRAGVARSTVVRAEGVDGVPPITRANLRAIETALTAAGVLFDAANGSVGYRPPPSRETG